jgi:hypothetical protein
MEVSRLRISITEKAEVRGVERDSKMAMKPC